MKLSKVRILIGVALFLVLAFLAFNCFTPQETVTLRPVPMGGDFTLQSDKGPFSLSSLKGKVALLYFGFTTCPDVCPTTMANVSGALNKLTPEEADKVKVLFVTVDPERDTLDRLKSYVGAFHKEIIPLVGEIPQLKQIVAQYGAYFNKVELKSAMGYTMDHSASLFVVDAEGRFVGTIPHGSSPDEIVKTIKEHLTVAKLNH